MTKATTATLGITDEMEVVRLATSERLGELVDIGDRFVFKPSAELTAEEDNEIALCVAAFNDRTIGVFWQEREAELAELHQDGQELKAISGGDYLTEEDVRRSVSGFPVEVAHAIFTLWKQGRIVSRGRNEYGEITWAARH